MRVDQLDNYDAKCRTVVIWKTCCSRLSYQTDIAALFRRAYSSSLCRVR